MLTVNIFTADQRWQLTNDHCSSSTFLFFLSFLQLVMKSLFSRNFALLRNFATFSRNFASRAQPYFENFVFFVLLWHCGTSDDHHETLLRSVVILQLFCLVCIQMFKWPALVVPPFENCSMFTFILRGNCYWVKLTEVKSWNLVLPEYFLWKFELRSNWLHKKIPQGPLWLCRWCFLWLWARVASNGFEDNEV